MSDAKPLVVVIEDDLASAEALVMLLRDWGGEAHHFGSATAAAAGLGPRIRDVIAIISDYHLGAGLDAIQGAHALKAQAPRARILMMSGSFHGKSANASEIAGLPLIQKPADATKILAWLDQTP
jgi:DNA-binding NtrC family response regulator